MCVGGVSGKDQSLRTAHLDLLVGAVDHGNEHVEQHHHHGDIVDAIEDITNVLNKLVVIFEHDGRDFRQAKYGPK